MATMRQAIAHACATKLQEAEAPTAIQHGVGTRKCWKVQTNQTIPSRKVGNVGGSKAHTH
eukprot:86546-Alexandrium_andersonii.AAC.1